ncbi:MAG: transposase [Flavobacterium sp.]|nr:transposase [Flavobacterium sp.]
MKEGYVIKDQNLSHFLTYTFVDIKKKLWRIHYRMLLFFIKNKQMILYSFITMSNHIHMIIHFKDGKLSYLLQYFKKFTAKTILEKITNEPESRRE